MHTGKYREHNSTLRPRHTCVDDAPRRRRRRRHRGARHPRACWPSVRHPFRGSRRGGRRKSAYTKTGLRPPIGSAAADPYPCVEPPTPLRSGLPDARPRSARTAPGVRAVDACKELVEKSRIIVAPEALSPAKRTEQAQIRDSAVRRKPTWQLARGSGESPNGESSATRSLRIIDGSARATNDTNTRSRTKRNATEQHELVRRLPLGERKSVRGCYASSHV